MYVVKVSVQDGALSEQTVSRLLDDLLCTWRMNGQLQIQCCDWGIYVLDGLYSVSVLTPAADALSVTHNSVYVNNAQEAFRANGLALPDIEILGREVDSLPECACQNRSAYILFNTCLSLESVIRCADCFDPVPLYTLPYPDSDEHHEIVCWAHDYECCDSLQMNCSVLERACTREMSDMNSSLNRAGLKICQALTDKTGIPVYHYLYKFNGRSLKQEKARKCPSCGGDWLLENPWHDSFDFRCDECRLISNIAFNVRH